MKKILLIILTMALFPVVELCAQTIKGIPYQTVVRDEQGNPVADQELTVRFYIQRTLSTRSGAQPVTLYSETHTATSDANGLVRLQVGEGIPIEGSFGAVDWWGKVSIETEIELAGSGEAVFTSTQELGTVPYALSAENALLLKSDDGTQWSLECDSDGTLKAVAIPERFTKLVFSDEFDGTGLLDDSKWGYEEGYVRNGEEQYYTVAREENAYMADGCLHIVCRNDSALIEDALYEQQWSGSHGYRADTIIPITSASVVTKGKFAFTYGRVEVRAKLPVCLGSWPAIWMFPQDRSDWPACGEIDIIEHVGYDPNNIYFTAHCTDFNSNNQPNRYANSAPIENPEDWHVYSFEWHPDRLLWFIDGELQATVLRGRTYSNTNWPYTKDFYLLLNFAFGGGWGGREGIDVTALPLEYVIDYVRIYQ